MPTSGDRLRAIMKKGVVHFVVVRGVLAWGGFMAVVLIGAMIYTLGFRALTEVRFILLAIAVCLVGGFVWGLPTYYASLLWLRIRKRGSGSV